MRSFLKENHLQSSMMHLAVLLTCIGLISATVLPQQAVENEGQSGKVVGGSNARPNTWKWQISLQNDHWNSGDFAHICGGSLIGANYVMTAAHCILDLDVKKYRVVLGEYDLSKAEGREQVRAVTRIKIHPGWTGDLATGNDIALMKLDSPVYDNGYVAIAEVPYSGQVLPNGFTCYITGWGLLATGGYMPDVLQEAPISVVDYTVCSTPAWWGSVVKKTMVCAGGDGLTSGCQGDSGGPLNCFSDDSWRVHGVVSFGSAVNCNLYSKPTVFTRVSAFIDWLYSEMV
ncbi:elastase-1-like [Ictalurus furcatus]|uniref:elastase-1-like n=1 Tax=Ictalurus furcatus TaxID=66913 RepID=UPI0023505E5B|nr:elastase-1-like [Ictalurus furcatus]